MTLASLTGFRWFDRSARGFEARFSWAEITSGWGLALALCSFEEHFSLHVHLGWPNVFFRLGLLQCWHREPHEGMESWGLSLFGRDIHINWGRHCRIVHLPWAYDWHRTSYLLANGSWLHDRGRGSQALSGFDHWQAIREQREARAWRETHPYRYERRSGEVQERTATIEVHEMEHRWRCLRWLPLFAKISRYIDVEFSGEIGERTGSWKGGTVGCSYALLPKETPLQCLRRMERERDF